MIRKIANTIGTRAFSAIFNLLIAILISQYLGTIGKGQQGLIIATITYILVFSNLIGGSTLVYLAPRYGVRRLLLPSYAWTLLMSLAFYFILKITHIVNPEFILNICILAILSSVISIHTNLLISLEKIRKANFLGVLQPLIVLALVLLFFIFSQDATIDKYILALYVSMAGTIVLSFFFLKKHFRNSNHSPQPQFKLIKEMFRLGILNQLSHIFQLLSFRMSYYWLGQVYSEAEVGIFSNGTSLIESVWLISRSISMVQYSKIVNMHKKKEAQKLTLDLSKLSFVLSFIFIIPLILLPSSVYVFIFGEGFGSVRTVIHSLAPGVLFLNLNIIISHYFSGTGKYHLNTIASFVGLCFAIPLFAWMIPSFGLTGAGFASSISYLITTSIILLYFKKESGVNFKEFIIKKNDILFLKQSIKNLFN